MPEELAAQLVEQRVRAGLVGQAPCNRVEEHPMTAVVHPSVDERIALGKAARERIAPVRLRRLGATREPASLRSTHGWAMTYVTDVAPRCCWCVVARKRATQYSSPSITPFRSIAHSGPWTKGGFVDR